MKHLIFALLFVSTLAYPQSKATDVSAPTVASQKKKPYKLSYKLTLNGQYNKGNVDRVLFTNKNTSLLKYKKFKLPVTYNFSYGRFKGKLNEREHYLNLNPSYENGSVKYYYLTEIEKSNLRNIDNRVLMGGGIGYSLMDTKAVDITVSDLILNENTRYTNHTEKHTIRNSVRLKMVVDSDKFRLSTVSFYQPSLLDLDNYRWTNTNTVELKILKPVSGVVSFDQNYESVVVKNKAKYNSSLTIGISYRID
jgi:hypothetical protein